MSQEIYVYISKKDQTHLFFDGEGNELNSVFIDCWGRSSILGSTVMEYLHNEEPVLVDSELYYDIKEELDEELKAAEDKLNIAREAFDKVSCKDSDAFWGLVDEIGDYDRDRRDYAEAVYAWSFIRRHMENANVWFVYSY